MDVLKKEKTTEKEENPHTANYPTSYPYFCQISILSTFNKYDNYTNLQNFLPDNNHPTKTPFLNIQISENGTR